MEKILTLSNVSSGYRNKTVCKDISFSVIKNDFVAIIGPNGAGKSTLLKTISKQVDYNSGSIKIFDKELSKLSMKERSKLCSFVFNISEALPTYTIRDFLAMHSYANDESLFKNISDEQIRNVLNECKIKLNLSDKINSLSSGEMQLVQIAGAVIQNKDFILLDEPIAHLDPLNRNHIINLLNKLNKNGATVITVLHDLNIALNCATKILSLKNGKIFFHETPQKVFQKKMMDILYEIKFKYFKKDGNHFCF